MRPRVDAIWTPSSASAVLDRDARSRAAAAGAAESPAGRPDEPATARGEDDGDERGCGGGPDHIASNAYVYDVAYGFGSVRERDLLDLARSRSR